MSAIPSALQKLIKESLQAMEADPDRELSMGRREAILCSSEKCFNRPDGDVKRRL